LRVTTRIGQGTEVGASGKMLSFTKQDNDARLFRWIAKKCLETSDRRFVQGDAVSGDQAA
jgi:hypothetical protein